ncbi:MAG: sialate O-acetylesterase [Planctomycetota bacterium]
MKLREVRSLSRGALVACGILCCQIAAADVRLPAIISDHMVVQRQMAAPIWGWADAGEEVTVALAGQSKSTTADADGRWMVKLDPMDAGGPHTLEVRGKNALTVSDVLVGEVWLGSGQSNMAMMVRNAADAEKEMAAAELPQMRQFKVEGNPQDKPQDDLRGAWAVCSPETVGTFSATAFFFGRELHKELGVPVGLINSSVGGTPIESWIDADTQRNSAALKPFFDAQSNQNAEFDEAAAKAQYEKQLEGWKKAVAEAKAQGKERPRQPRDPIATKARKGNVGGLFNGMIAPLIPYGIRGAIWYQGEANSTPEKAPFYQYQLPLLVRDWRARWGQGDFPFAWVQLPNYEGAGRDWPTVREGMLKALATPNTGMAIAIDVGEPKDIHPKNKQAVGKRLALWALGADYGKDVATSGPLYEGHEVSGGALAIRFKHAGGGLQAKDGELRGFEVTGADGVWQPAEARIEGSTVVVTSKDVPQPLVARYGWSNNPDCNLYNAAGLPASPFRTADRN